MTTSQRRRNPLALSGVLFVAFFIASLVLSGVLASAPLPMPDAPATETARYFADSQAAVLVSGLLQALSATSLLVFARRTAGEGSVLAGTTLVGGASAAVLLLLSALLSWALVPVAAGGDLALIGTLRDLSFLTGGTLHVAALGVFVGAGSIAALRAQAFPRWLLWLGVAAAVLSILSLTSLLWFPASILIPLGRLLAFVWTVAVSIVLMRGHTTHDG